MATLNPETQRIMVLVQKITDLPTLPTLLTTLTKLIQDPKTSADQLSRALSTDPTLVSKVLKLVNSAFYGFPGRIGTVTQAIVIMGFSSIRNIVLTSSVLKMWDSSRPIQRFDVQAFWRHSLMTAALSKSIAIEKNIPFIEELFIGGLLHDIGRMVLSNKLPDEFEKVLDWSEKHQCPWLESERAVLGLTHADLGAFLAKKWNLPAPLIEIIRCHHSPENAPTGPNSPLAGDAAPSLGIVRLADALSQIVTNGELPLEFSSLIDPVLWEENFKGQPHSASFRDRCHEEIGRALAYLS